MKKPVTAILSLLLLFQVLLGLSAPCAHEAGESVCQEHGCEEQDSTCLPVFCGHDSHEHCGEVHECPQPRTVPPQRALQALPPVMPPAPVEAILPHMAQEPLVPPPSVISPFPGTPLLVLRI